MTEPTKPALSVEQEAHILASLMDSLIRQHCPDSVSGYDIMDAIRPSIISSNKASRRHALGEVIRMLRERSNKILVTGAYDAAPAAGALEALADKLEAELKAEAPHAH